MVGWTRRNSENRERNSRPVSQAEIEKNSRAVIAIVLTAIILFAVNFVDVPRIDVTATVVYKDLIPAHRAHHVVTRGRYNVPEQYFLGVTFDGDYYGIHVDSEFYNKTSVGDKIRVTYVKQRILRAINIVSFDR
jgi:hypothetical protein